MALAGGFFFKRGSSAPTVSAPEDGVRTGLPDVLPRLWRYGLVLARRRDIAEDLVQATCVRALERAGQFAPGTKLDRWLFSILHGIWIDELRKRQVRLGQGVVDAGDVMLADPAADTETRAFANQIIARIDALPEAQRATVFLAYVEGMSYREVAETLNIPVGTVMSRLSNARAKLAGSVEKEV